MDTEGGDLLWHEELVVVDKAKAAEVFEPTIIAHSITMNIQITPLHEWRRRSYTTGEQVTLLTPYMLNLNSSSSAY